jgi:hypothetical protein
MIENPILHGAQTPTLQDLKPKHSAQEKGRAAQQINPETM